MRIKKKQVVVVFEIDERMDEKEMSDAIGGVQYNEIDIWFLF